MILVNNISFSRMNEKELSVYAVRVTEIFKNAGLKDDTSNLLTDLLEDNIKILESAVGRDLKSAYTKTLDAKDKTRDAAFKFLRDYIESYINSPDTDDKAASALLMGYINFRGYQLYRKGYSEQTHITRLLFDDLDKSESQTAIEKLNAKTRYQALIDAQKDFEDNYNEKLETESKEDIPRTKVAKGNLIRNLNSLIYVMNVHIESKPDQYEESAKQINDAGIDTMTITRARLTRKENTTEGTD